MTAIVIREEGASLPLANAGKDGTDYDRCPVDGCKEVDLSFKSGGRAPDGAEYRDWSIFSADMRDGGCGASWARTTEQGAVRDRAIGREPAILTQSAALSRTILLPPQSEEYSLRYDHAFKKCSCASGKPCAIGRL